MTLAERGKLARLRFYARLMNRHAVTLALLSAALFGASTPAAKSLLGAIDPAMLAELLDCGAGAGVAVLRAFFVRGSPMRGTAEASLTRSDLPWLAGAIVAGGIVGPILLMADWRAPTRPRRRCS